MPYRKPIKMSKTTKWLVGLVAVLMVVNIALLATIWLKRNGTTGPPAFKGNARDFLVDTLSLNDSQVRNFDSLRQAHFKKIDDDKRKLLFLRDRLFALLSEKDTSRIKTQIKDFLQQKIGEVQADIDLETFRHFYQLRSTLNEQQKQRFDSVIQNVLRTLDPRGNGPGGPMPHEAPPDEGRDGMLPPPPNGPPPRKSTGDLLKSPFHF